MRCNYYGKIAHFIVYNMIGLIVITGKWKNRELEGREMSQVPPLSVTGHCRQPRPCLGQVRSGPGHRPEERTAVERRHRLEPTRQGQCRVHPQWGPPQEGLSPPGASDPCWASLGTLTAGSPPPAGHMDSKEGAAAEVELEGQILYQVKRLHEICRAFEFLEGFYQSYSPTPVSPNMSNLVFS